MNNLEEQEITKYLTNYGWKNLIPLVDRKLTSQIYKIIIESQENTETNDLQIYNVLIAYKNDDNLMLMKNLTGMCKPLYFFQLGILLDYDRMRDKLVGFVQIEKHIGFLTQNMKSEAAYVLANYHMIRGNLDQVISNYETASMFGHEQSMLDLGDLYLNAGKIDRAKIFYNMVIEKGNCIAYGRMAILFQKTKDPNEYANYQNKYCHKMIKHFLDRIPK